MMPGDDKYDIAFRAAVGAYCEGAYETVAEAEEGFKEQVTGDGGT